MVTTLFLVRHGETVGAEKMRYKGTIDVPLSENGIQQMERLAEYISRHSGHRPPTHASPSRGVVGIDSYRGKGGGESHSSKLSAIYTSDLGRAIKSSEIVARSHGIKPIIIPDLRERNFGIWESMSFDEIKERYPREFAAWVENPLKFSPMDGENTLEVKERVVRAIDEIILRHNEGRVAVISHGGVNRIILCHFLGIPLENIFRIEQDFAAVNIIEFCNGYPIVKLINGIVNYLSGLIFSDREKK